MNKYVSNKGSGKHDGSSEENAWTLEEAEDAVLVGGDITLQFLNETYDNMPPFFFAYFGLSEAASTSKRDIKFRGYNSTIGDLEPTDET